MDTDIHMHAVRKADRKTLLFFLLCHETRLLQHSGIMGDDVKGKSGPF